MHANGRQRFIQKPFDTIKKVPQAVYPASTDTLTVPDTLSLAQARSLTLERNPLLRSATLNTHIAEAKKYQAALRPNPVGSIELENFSGTGSMRRFRTLETTYSLGWPLLLGGDRRKNLHVAEHTRQLTLYEEQATGLRLLAGLTKAFIMVLETQRQVELDRQLSTISHNLYNSIASQVTAGKVARLAQIKAEVEVARTDVELARAQRNLEIARNTLAAFWVSDRAGFRYLKGDLEATPPLPKRDSLQVHLRQNPYLLSRQSFLEQHKARLSFEKAVAVPNPTLYGGIRYLNGIHARAFVAGLSVPLPLFNRNQGNIQAAHLGVQRAEALNRFTTTRIQTETDRIYQQLLADSSEIQQLRRRVLPASRAAFDAAREGYRQGKFGYLDLLDAQRTLFAARKRYVRVLAQYHRNYAAMQQLTGSYPVKRSPR